MLDVQHAHTEHVVSSMHVHLSHDLCMEVIALRGPSPVLRSLAAELSGMTGIHQAQLVIVSADETNGNRHGHDDHGHPHPH
jgi:CopG family nickel-responsive transcriptional regulator